MILNELQLTSCESFHKSFHTNDMVRVKETEIFRPHFNKSNFKCSFNLDEFWKHFISFPKILKFNKKFFINIIYIFPSLIQMIVLGKNIFKPGLYTYYKSFPIDRVCLRLLSIFCLVLWRNPVVCCVGPSTNRFPQDPCPYFPSK